MECVAVGTKRGTNASCRLQALSTLPPLIAYPACCRQAPWWSQTAPPPRQQYPISSGTAWALPLARFCRSCRQQRAAAVQHEGQRQRQQKMGVFSRWLPVWRLAQMWREQALWCSTCCATGGWPLAGRPPWQPCSGTGRGAAGAAAAAGGGATLSPSRWGQCSAQLCEELCCPFSWGEGASMSSIVHGGAIYKS